jgi:hypothetical protein
VKQYHFPFIIFLTLKNKKAACGPFPPFFCFAGYPSEAEKGGGAKQK